VTPQENGVFSVNLIATVGEGDQMLARTFSIPVVVGSEAMQSEKARKLNVEVDSTGQAIEVMPGQESR
jgi:phosphoenolpyruvate-protein kinase (PTS system EI component)